MIQKFVALKGDQGIGLCESKRSDLGIKTFE
jgi:hypothetical protein